VAVVDLTQTAHHLLSQLSLPVVEREQFLPVMALQAVQVQAVLLYRVIQQQRVEQVIQVHIPQ